MKEKQRCVSSGWKKIMSPKDRSKAYMPSTRSLLETIESLHKTSQMIRARRVNKPRWLT
jgi:hypothetical protein